eukprot:3703142-Karenia_brevis.AAC.1
MWRHCSEKVLELVQSRNRQWQCVELAHSRNRQCQCLLVRRVGKVHRGGHGEWRNYPMRCACQNLLLEFISMSSAISACRKGGQWERVAPLLNEM